MAGIVPSDPEVPIRLATFDQLLGPLAKPKPGAPFKPYFGLSGIIGPQLNPASWLDWDWESNLAPCQPV
jgi:hypothetical protein